MLNIRWKSKARQKAKQFNLIISTLLLLIGISVAESQTIRLGVYELPPMIFNAPDGSTIGLFPEVLEDIADQEGWTIEYVHGSKEECLSRLTRGEIDLMVDQKNHSHEFRTSDAAIINWNAVFFRTDLPIESFEDMEGKKLAITHQDAQKNDPAGILAQLKRLGVSCSFTEVDNYREMFMLLSERQVDGGVTDHLLGTPLSFSGDTLATPFVLNPHSLHFSALRKSEKAKQIIETINAHLKLQKNDPDSVYNQAMAYYLSGGRQDWKEANPDYSDEVPLTEGERAWLREHPVIRIGIDPEFAPFEAIGTKTNNEGIAADYLQIVSNRIGLKFELIRKPSWPKTIQALKDGEIDLLPCIGKTDERSRFMQFTDPYLHFSRVIITRSDSEIDSLEDLKGSAVGVQDNSSHHGFLQNETNLKLQLYPSFEEVLLAVSKGEIDAAVGNLTVTTHTIHKLMLTNIKMAAYASPESNNLYMGVRKDWPELTSILNRTLQSISLRDRNAIFAKWMPLQKPLDPSLDLSQEEREWLSMHPVVRVSWDKGWPPIEFADKNGNPQGISFDYLSSLSSMLGIEFEPCPAMSWQEAYSLLLNKETDMSTCLSVTEERLNHFDYTDTYLSSPVVLFGKGNMAYIRTLNELQSFRVAVVKDYATDQWISRDHPEISLVRSDSVEEALALLQEGNVDVFIGNVIIGNYYLSRLRNNDIKIIGETPYTYHLRMAVRKDWPVLAGILRKAMLAMPEEDRTAFYRNWVWLKYEHGFNYPLFWKIMITATVIILTILIWNHRLRKEILSRKQAEASLSQSRTELSESYSQLKKMEELKENLMHMVMHDMRSPLQTVSGTLQFLLTDPKLSRYAQEEEDFLLMAMGASRQLNEMIQAMLDITRMESDQMTLQKNSLNLIDITKTAIQSLKIQLDQKDCTTSLQGVPTLIDADENIMRRVLVNLVQNAIKATPEKGTIAIRIMETPSQAITEIQDWGCGIPAEMQPRIFDKFCRIENHCNAAFSSVGLGLTFCKMAVEAHNGKIEVESAEGKGTTFRIMLPKSADSF